MSVWSCVNWNNAVVKISSCLRHYFIAVAFLHISKRSKKHSLSDELLDVLAILVRRFVGKRRYCRQLSKHNMSSSLQRNCLQHYLYIRCLSVMNCRQFTQILSTDEVQQHTKHILNSDQLLIADVILLKLIKMSSGLKCQYKPRIERRQYSTINTAELDTSELVELLQQSAVGHLTTYRQLQRQEFGSVAMIVTTDFEALYAYKHGDYQRCLSYTRCCMLMSLPMC